MKTTPQTPRRLFAWSAGALGLCLLPGCGLTANVRHEPDHVYSTTTPQMLEQQGGASPLPARACYPDENSHAAIMPSSSSADGVARLNALPPAYVAENHFAQLAGVRSDAAPVSEFQLTSFSPNQFGQPPADNGIPFCPAEPRLDFDPNHQPSNQMETTAASPLADFYPDEYVFDGGDRDLSAAMHSDRSGLDTEDTVAAFTDHTGADRVSPSNRVAVYAPRFGSVKTVVSLVADVKIDKAVGAKDSIAVNNLKTGNAAQENVHDTVLYGMETRDRVDGMKNALPPMQTHRTEVANQNHKIDEGQEGRAVSGPETFNRNQGFILAQQQQNAIIWTRDQFPVITATTTNASEISAKFKVQQTVGVKDERETKGNIQIVKLADRDVAQSGETISFTIRFQNIGDFDVYEVSIVDNLTPRLGYVAGSASIDAKHPGEVSVEPNGEGSSILTFKLDQPLKGHESGTITFEAVVR